MTNSNSDRFDRIEQNLERSTQLLERTLQIQERIILTQEQQQEQIQILLNAATRHETRIDRQDALIERLDAILERLVYREGRNGEGDPPQA